MSMIRVVFAAPEKEKIWETDYIMNCILPEVPKEEVFVPFEQIQNGNVTADVFVYNCRLHSYEDVLSVVKKMKPKVIFHLSDEYWFENLSQWNELANYCDVFLRQHHHPGFVYTDNTIQMPLGYCNDAGVEGKTIPNISERKYNWAFIGDMKTDRWEMVEAFSSIKKNFTGSGISKPEMMDIYLNSIFVPSGRGNSSINCFRLYEASMSGAIPVLVGSQDELDLTFMYEENPPWIFADTWENAVKICKKLLRNKKQLQETQHKILLWWKSRVGKIRERISKVLTEKTEETKIEHIYQKDQFGENWFGYQTVYYNMVRRFDSGSRFVEVGCWKGRSTSFMAVEIANSNKDIDFFCVDNWIDGDIENAFNNNMSSLKDYFIPIKSDSLDAANKFQDESLDFVFLDASLTFAETQRDINAWLPKIKPGGILAGHDYYVDGVNWFPEVKDAVDQLLDEVDTMENCFIYYKPDPTKLNGMPPVHFISVDDSVERRELLLQKFEKFGITNVTPHIYKRYKDEDHIIESDLIHRLSIGSRGPVTSHLKAIREWYENTDEQVAFFCEDDLSLETVKYWNFTWQEFYEKIPKDWGCIQLAWLREGSEDFYRFSIGFRNRCWCDWSGCAYLITREHARLLIENYYYDDVFRLNLVGEHVDQREEWARVPVIETIIFSPVTKVYGMPMFVEDVVGCKSSYLGLVGSQIGGQCDVHHMQSYLSAKYWWKTTGQLHKFENLMVV